MPQQQQGHLRVRELSEGVQELGRFLDTVLGVRVAVRGVSDWPSQQLVVAVLTVGGVKWEEGAV